MNRWTRLTTVLTVAATATALVLGSASAASSSAPAVPDPPAAGLPIAATRAQTAAITPLITPRPPARPEASYVAITPCRIVDTRSAVGPLGDGTTRNYFVGGTFGFAPQGGRSGGCGIPAGATAVAATLTAVSPTHSGFLRAWPPNVSEPGATVLNYPAASSTGTGATLSLQTNTTVQSLRVKNYGGPTNLVIDVTGYYAQPLEGMIAPTGPLYAGSNRLVSATNVSPGNYTVTWDTDVSYCTPTVNPYPLDATPNWYATAYNFDGKITIVTVWKLNATTHLPVPTNDYFYLSISC